MPNTTTNNNVDPIILAINNLSENDRQVLTEKVRTTPSGISAFKAFNFGVGTPATTTTGDTTTGTSTDTGTTNDTTTSDTTTDEPIANELPPQP